MAETGEDKLFAAAREIAITLGKDQAMTEDIFQKLVGKIGEDNSRPSVRATLERSLNSLDRQISAYLAADQPIWSNPSDSSAFLDLIDELIVTTRDWGPMARDKSISICLSRADDLIQHAMFRLQDEFKYVMHRSGDSFDSEDDEFDDEEEEENDGGNQIAVARPIADYAIVIDALPSITIGDLHEIAKRMVAAGFGKECSHVYSSWRREFLEESMSRLRLKKLSIEEVQEMPWQDLEDEIDRWIKAVNLAVRVFFPSERLLCDYIFSSTADLSFMEACRGTTTQLLNFADAIAIGSRSPERLFKVIDVYETMRDLMPLFESLFSDQYCSILRNETIAIQKRLGEAIRGIFMELENLIRRDPAKTAVPGGGLHPINRYVMNYLRAVCKSQQTLEQVFEENNKGVVSRETTTLSVQMTWFLELLESNLEAKSKIYGDPSLCFVFMMNNGKYIAEKVKGSELGLILGEDWIAKHNAKLKQYRSNYRRSSWNQVVGVLNSEDNMNSPAKSMKEALRLFNTYLDEICKMQSTWVVIDEQLREELRISVVRLVLPAYGSFIGRFKNLPEIRKYAGRHIRYSIEDVEARIKELFQGT